MDGDEGRARYEALAEILDSKFKDVISEALSDPENPEAMIIDAPALAAVISASIGCILALLGTRSRGDHEKYKQAVEISRTLIEASLAEADTMWESHRVLRANHLHKDASKGRH